MLNLSFFISPEQFAESVFVVDVLHSARREYEFSLVLGALLSPGTRVSNSSVVFRWDNIYFFISFIFYFFLFQIFFSILLVFSLTHSPTIGIPGIGYCRGGFFFGLDKLLCVMAASVAFPQSNFSWNFFFCVWLTLCAWCQWKLLSCVNSPKQRRLNPL